MRINTHNDVSMININEDNLCVLSRQCSSVTFFPLPKTNETFGVLKLDRHSIFRFVAAR